MSVPSRITVCGLDSLSSERLLFLSMQFRLSASRGKTDLKLKEDHVYQTIHPLTQNTKERELLFKSIAWLLRSERRDTRYKTLKTTKYVHN